MTKFFMGIMLAAILALGSKASAYEPRVDGSWFASGNYGGDGDTVVGEVKQQQKDYDAAATAADSALSDWKSSRSDADAAVLLKARKEAARLATFSWVQAEWYLAIADDALDAGDKANAAIYYQKALDASVKASALTNVSGDVEWLTRSGKDVVAGSHAKGDKDQRLAQSGLDKCK